MRKETGCPLLPATAITSENWGDLGGFGVFFSFRTMLFLPIRVCPGFARQIIPGRLPPNPQGRDTASSVLRAGDPPAPLSSSRQPAMYLRRQMSFLPDPGGEGVMPSTGATPPTHHTLRGRDPVRGSLRIRA